jgi:Restriction endonuclease
MPRYDFRSLSSQDFEELVRDLLQAEWKVPLEAFRTGRDGGIDLRYAAAGGATVIQCKHYVGSGVARLLAHLRESELPKICRLGPSRYLVATSVSLTPGNKDEIVAALRPFILSAQDVLGADDVEGLLSRHPNVERANFKLWLTRTSALERVLHNATLCQTDFEVERLRRKLPLFVRSDAYPRATDILNETRIVVITGPPGIGKTTLAEMLLYAHLEDGYEPIAIKAEISEAKHLFKIDRKQIFYYDDFLGQTFLGDRREYLGRNQDAAMVDFMEMVRRSQHSRFILTD